jgi:hypothetical protein
MQFTRPFKEAIARGDVRRSYRCWAGPRVKVGGRYGIPPLGAIEVTALAEVDSSSVTNAAARASGFESLDELRATLGNPSDASRKLYRVDFRFLGPDPISQPERDRVDQPTLASLRARLDAIDARARPGPWAWATVAAIGAEPGRRAADLAPRVGLYTATFKARVRRLKALGLTESLETGYRLSPRGRQLLARR